tara:strand:+ start:1921 stop:2208 length:288 start_codon:yes stop_codon:yes gene_type:complete
MKDCRETNLRLFGASLKRWRKAVGKTQKEAVEELPTFKGHYPHIEQGRTAKLTRAECDRLNELFKLPPDTVFEAILNVWRCDSNGKVSDVLDYLA